MEFAAPPGEMRNASSIHISRFRRTGMERRSWFPEYNGATRMLNIPLWWEWTSAPGVVQVDQLDLTTTDISHEWGTLGEVGRGERDLESEATDDARGWPWLAFWCELDHGRKPGTACSVKGGIQLPTKGRGVGDVRCIPLRPLWDGVVLNTLVYSAAWGALLIGVPAGRRTIRRSRGRCPRCAYDLLGEFTAGCPECGWNKDPKLPP
jgi:hypothetical protein